MNNQYIFLSGMPRTGSNLLSSILNQNNLFYSEGFSAMCNILWNFDLSINEKNTKNELLAVNKYNKKKIKEMGIGLFDSYYKLENKIIFDKCTSWTINDNINLLKKYVADKPKIIVLTRNIKDVTKSYVNVLLKNNFSQTDAEQIVLNFDELGSNPLMRPIAGIMNSKINRKNADFLYVDYEDLVFNTEQTIKNIYKFCNTPFYKHDYNNIKLKYKENEDIILKGFMDVRPQISKKEINIELSKKALNKIESIEKLLNEIDINYKKTETVKKFEKFYYLNAQ